jgi:hypothetical protein
MDLIGRSERAEAAIRYVSAHVDYEEKDFRNG